MSQPPKTKDMLGRNSLTPVDTATNILLKAIDGIQVDSENRPLEECLNRILADTVHSPEDLPNHPRSTMDGYAVFASDTFGATQSMPCYLPIAGEILMGELPTAPLERGTCIKISTGGLLPPGADAVVMLEHTIQIDETMLEIVKSVGTGTNLINYGEDIQKDSTALPAGHLLRPQDLGLLAGLGITHLNVHRKVRVGTLSTGDEIVPHTETPAPGKIRDINGITLGGQIANCGAEVNHYGIIKDTEETFYPALEKCVAENDIVLFSGGSSVGMRDLGERAIETLGNPGILVHGVALKPGKPVIIGLHDITPVFGLPGHPVSAMVCFDFFVKPAIEHLSGLKPLTEASLPSVTAYLHRNINSAAGRRDLVRVQLQKKDDTLLAVPVLGKSGSISTLSRAHGYFLIDESSQGANENSEIEVFLYT